MGRLSILVCSLVVVAALAVLAVPAGAQPETAGPVPGTSCAAHPGADLQLPAEAPLPQLVAAPTCGDLACGVSSSYCKGKLVGSLCHDGYGTCTRFCGFGLTVACSCNANPPMAVSRETGPTRALDGTP